jgi:hypothetical protein
MLVSRPFHPQSVGIDAAPAIVMDDKEIRDNFSRIDSRFTQVDAQFAEIRQLIVSEGEQTRKHFDAVAEGLEDRIDLIGEGYEALETDNTEIKHGLQRLETGQDRLEVLVLAVESRVTSLEKTQKIVLTEVRGLAMKVHRAPRTRPRRR